MASDIPVLLLLYEMVLHCYYEPENIVWIAEFNTGYIGEVTHQWIIIYNKW